MRRYLPSDLDAVNAWHAARGMPLLTADVLPWSGRIVEGVAAGFLYRTDASLCLLDGFVTNPVAPLCRRYRALGEIVDALTAEALASGVRHVLGLTARAGMRRIVERRGFKAAGVYQMMTMEG